MDSLRFDREILKRAVDGQPSIAYYIPKVTSAVNVDPDDFNREIARFAISCFSHDCKTPRDANVMVKDVFNAMYFDLDWHWHQIGTDFEKLENDSYSWTNTEKDALANNKSESEIEELNTAVASWLTNHVENIILQYLNDNPGRIRDDNINAPFKFTMLPFVPCEQLGDKGGVHLFVFFDTNVFKAKPDIYDYMIANIKKCEILNNISLETILDKGPLISSCILIPFAKKSPESRQYKYLPQLAISDEPESTFDNLFIGTTVHNETKCADEGANVLPLLMNEEFDYRSSINRQLFSGFAGQLMDSLYAIRYFDPNNIFFELIREHDNRYASIGRITYYFIRLAIAIVSPNSYSDSNVDRIVFNVWAHWLMTMRKIAEPTKSEAELMDSIQSNKEYVKGKNSDYYKHNLWIKIGCIFNRLDVSIFKSLHVNAIDGDAFNRITNEDFSNMQPAYRTVYKTLEVYEIEAMSELRSLRNQIKNIYHDFIEIYRCVLSRLTTEVIPFTLDNGKVIRNLTVVNNSVKTPDNEYNEFMINIMRLQILCNCVHKGVPDVDLLDCICNFIKYFVFTTDTGVYIYNVNQSNELAGLPANQFILDNAGGKDGNGAWVTGWIRKIFNEYLYHPLYANISDFEQSFAILFMIGGIEGRIPSAKDMDKLSKLIPKAFSIDGAKNVVNEVFRYRLSKTTQLPRAPDKLKTPYDYGTPINVDENSSMGVLPTHYGFLRFYYNQEKACPDYRYTTSNFDIYSSHVAPVVYYGEEFPKSPHYQKAYDDIVKVFNDILPEEEVRTYVMSQLACTLDSRIARNICLLFIGSGGDGKSTIMKMMQAYLGLTDANKSNIKHYKDPITYQDQNRKCSLGFASEINREALNSRATAGHDSEFACKLIGARFVSIEEVAVTSGAGTVATFNGSSRFKQMLGENQMPARAAYSPVSVSFTPNCIVGMTSNNRVSFNECNDAMRRRLAVVNTKSKFTTDKSKLDRQMDRVKEADRELSNNIVSDPVYADAIFYVMLDTWKNHVAKLYKNSSLSAQSIPKPLAIESDVDTMLNSGVPFENEIASSLISLDDESVKTCGKYFIYSVHEIVNELKNHVTAYLAKMEKLHKNMKKVDVTETIIATLNNKFSGRFLQLDSRFDIPGSSGMRRQIETEIKANTYNNMVALYNGTKDFKDPTPFYQYFIKNDSGTYYRDEISIANKRQLNKYYVTEVLDIFTFVQSWFNKLPPQQDITCFDIADIVRSSVEEELYDTGVVLGATCNSNELISGNCPVNKNIATALEIEIDNEGHIMFQSVNKQMMADLSGYSSSIYSDSEVQ